MPDAAALARLCAAFRGEYEITACGGVLRAWRNDGTTPVVQAEDLAGLRTGIAENRRLRPRLTAA